MFNNNNILKKKKKRVKSIRCQQESQVSAMHVYRGGRDGVVQTGKEGPWLERFFSSLVSKEGGRILSS